MVLEAGQATDAQGWVDVGDDLADSAPLAATAADVEHAEALHRLALRTAEYFTDVLVAGADREDDRAAGGGGSQAAVVLQASRGQHLRQVLAAAEQVDVAF